MIPIDSLVYYAALLPASLVLGLCFHLLFWIGLQFFINN